MEALNPIPPRGLIKGFTEFRSLLLLRLSSAFRGNEKERKKEGKGKVLALGLSLSVNISNGAVYHI